MYVGVGGNPGVSHPRLQDYQMRMKRVTFALKNHLDFRRLVGFFDLGDLRTEAFALRTIGGSMTFKKCIRPVLSPTMITLSSGVNTQARSCASPVKLASTLPSRKSQNFNV